MSWFDFLTPRVIAEFSSPYNGQIQVVDVPYDRYISVGNLTQSGGLVREVWKKTLSRLSRPSGKSWLVLGLAGGTLAKFISQKNHPSEIVGVEIDPVMVTIGQKYFNLDQIPELKIVNQDAFDYLKHSSSQFDRIIIDMYFADTQPKFINSSDFIHLLVSHIKPGGFVVFNHLFYDPAKKSQAEKLIFCLKQFFPKITLVRKLSNILIICS